MIYVTHDQVEAMTLADRIVILNHEITLQDKLLEMIQLGGLKKQNHIIKTHI